MTIQSIDPTPVFPGGPTNAYIEGVNDGYEVGLSTAAHRIAWFRDTFGQAWADDYAAGAFKGHRDRAVVDALRESLNDDSIDQFIASQNGYSL